MNTSPWTTKKAATLKYSLTKLNEALKALEAEFDSKGGNSKKINIISLVSEVVDLFKGHEIVNHADIKKNMISFAIVILRLLEKMTSGEMTSDLKEVMKKINLDSKMLLAV